MKKYKAGLELEGWEPIMRIKKLRIGPIPERGPLQLKCLASIDTVCQKGQVIKINFTRESVYIKGYISFPDLFFNHYKKADWAFPFCLTM